MGRLSQLGGAMLGAAVAFNAGEALSQGKPELPQKGFLSSQIQDFAQYRYAILSTAMTADQGDTAIRVREAEESGGLVRRNGSLISIYWQLKPLGLDAVSGEPIFEYLGYKQRECITADSYEDTFKIHATGETVVVLDGDDQMDQVTCPELPAQQSAQVKETSKPVAASEYVPHPGRFADLEPLLVKQGIFLVPVREIGITEEVPAELSGTAYVTQTDQAKGKRVVYRQYVLDNYEPKTGTVRIHDGGNQEQCVETTSYQDKKLGDKTSYILSVPGSLEMEEVKCEEEAAPKPVVKTPGTEARSKESKPWEVPVRAGLNLGADVEETSEYSLGNAPALHVSVQAQPFAIPLEFGLSGDFIFTEDGSGLEGVDLMVGGQPVEKVPVRGYLTVGDSFEARARYKETALNGAFSYGVLVEGDIYKFTLGGQALAVNCHASAQQHLYGGGGLSVWNPATGCGVVWDTVVSGGGKEKKERPMVSDAAVSAASAVTVEAQPKGPHLEMETKPYTYEVPVFKETKSEEKKASASQRFEAMRKKAQRNTWDGVEEDYNIAIALKIPLSFKTHWYGAEAARAAGDMQECYERMLLARAVATTEGERGEADSFLADVALNYSSVEIIVKAGGEISFVPSSMPFPPDQRTAIVFSQAEIADGSFEGFLPRILNLDGTQGTYTLNGQTIEFSDLKPVSDQVTTEIRLEK